MSAHGRSPGRPAAGRVRIIGGTLRNSRLDVPDLPGLRPTAERVRETLFNWLAPVIEGAHCVDLFAGTGALGIEAISRGAASARLIEQEPRAARGLRANLARLKLECAQLSELDALDFLRRPAGPGERFDLAFLDPPFAQNLWEPVARQLEQGDWLAPSAWIYVESPRDAALALPANWRPHRNGQAGEVAYALYRRL
jgi:16S rRNA (guanine966-N2)-methyltransferase